MKKIMIIFEMANNHFGDIPYGCQIINEFAKIIPKFNLFFDFAFKFQLRNIETFIHKKYIDDKNNKYVQRFKECKLNKESLNVLKEHAKKHNFKVICTAFDEPSVDIIKELQFDYIKIASCSLTDWSLINKISTIDIPIIASTATASLDDISKVISFFVHRNKNISLMHCIGEYPTNPEHFQLNQIDLLKNHYPTIKVGLSTHEEPTQYDSIQIAIAKNAEIIEKHVCLESNLFPKPNNYSATPNEIEIWLENGKKTLNMCGISNIRYIPTNKEIDDLLKFKRGVFLKNDIPENTIIEKENLYYAWPNLPNQILANDMSKYIQLKSKTPLKKDNPIYIQDVQITNTRKNIWDIVQKVKNLLKKSGVVFPGNSQLEISHHYGVENFYEYGTTMITVVNDKYCKKIIVVLPEQKHPKQYHQEKTETFMILYGELNLDIEFNGIQDKKLHLEKGNTVTIPPFYIHSFYSKTGCIFEELSTTHIANDSFYIDKIIEENKNRKTIVNYWL